MRRAFLSVPAGLLAGVLVLAGTLPAQGAKRAGDVWDVPGAAQLTISGRGFGHGHGMSQYGAEGAAREGLDHRQIAAFYYPGTQWGTSSGSVRVQLTADTSPRTLVVRARPGLTLRDTASAGRTVLPSNGATHWRVVVDRAGAGRVSYRTDRWRPWARLTGRGEFFAGSAPITLVTPSGERAYRGRLRTALTSSGTPVTVNELSMESYLRGVVSLEIPASWSAAAYPP